MSKTLQKQHLVALALFMLVGAARAQEVAALLRAADAFRSGAARQQIETEIQQLNADGSIAKQRRYKVFTEDRHRSLVLMQSPAEKGQKVLMLGDDFWLLMPGSQRAMRITPTQKLLGDASTGDIATLSWSEDYTGQLLGEERCLEPVPQACLHLSLRALRKGVSYQRIELWLGKHRHEPLRADLYVQSDKLAKQARFVFDKPGAPSQVIEMWLQDQLSHRRETRVRYLGRVDRSLPEMWFNPMFLARNPNLD